MTPDNRGQAFRIIGFLAFGAGMFGLLIFIGYLVVLFDRGEWTPPAPSDPLWGPLLALTVPIASIGFGGWLLWRFEQEWSEIRMGAIWVGLERIRRSRSTDRADLNKSIRMLQEDIEASSPAARARRQMVGVEPD